jgi:UPF0176 protein
MVIVAAFYQFISLPNYQDLQPFLKDFCQQRAIKGTILLALEGINGTVAGSRESITQLHGWLSSQFCQLEYKESWAKDCPFYRIKVRLKKEIVTLGVPEVSPIHQVGTYVSPQEWNRLIQKKEAIVVDVRNDYEVQIGTFKGAINPKTQTFREFPEFVQKNLMNSKDRPIVMCCTGGIRCEKSTSYLKLLGFQEVYHLKGGILKYLEEIPPEESLWEGACFVFDHRVGIDHGLAVADFSQCYGCRRPLTSQDRQSPHYEEGVRCHHCYDQYSEAHYRRASERHQQIQRAQSRGYRHIAPHESDSLPL